MEDKTNVMRILDQKKISYTAHTYDNSKAISGTEVAAYLNQNPDRVFKTLVTVAKSGKNYVFVIICMLCYLNGTKKKEKQGGTLWKF